MERPRWRDQSGLTLIEILVALAIIMIGLVAIMQWFPVGTQGMDTGRRQSTAVFLAEQKIEQIRSWALSTAAGQGFSTVDAGGLCFTAADGACRNDGFATIPGYPEFSRTVTVQCVNSGPPPTVVASPCPASATSRLVRVQVAYRQVTAVGIFGGGNQVDLATMIAQH